MRIVAGQLRGRRLAALGKGDPAAHLRPTSDRVRESLFSLLTHLDVIQDAKVLDLFAGTGALGLEAVSRGAAHATLVENGRKSLSVLSENIQLTRTQEQTSVLRRDATRLGTNPGVTFDLVFLDPPYGKAMGERAMKSAVAGGWLAPGARIIWEEGGAIAPPVGFTQLDSRKYGDTVITILGWDGHDQTGDF